ncbi:hypothetical protein C5167_009227 [Papaver somniferum]|uniref:Uncharacterized protein n=1 Tax=Papaver somniferum TaxID=3469 RepID=A0A4Y7JWS5_PAPSO|nr:hypothetical protein C5167_009227 [Papaver somniferum]
MRIFRNASGGVSGIAMVALELEMTGVRRAMLCRECVVKQLSVGNGDPLVCPSTHAIPPPMVSMYEVISVLQLLDRQVTHVGLVFEVHMGWINENDAMAATVLQIDALKCTLEEWWIHKMLGIISAWSMLKNLPGLGHWLSGSC